MKPVVSIVVATNRPWLWARLGRQYASLTTEHVDLELVIVADAFEQISGYFLDLVDVLPLHAGFVMRSVPVGTKVGDKFRMGAEWAHGDFVAYRSDDSIWHPRQFDRLYRAWTERNEYRWVREDVEFKEPYVGWGHGWFYMPHRHGEMLHHMQTGLVVVGTALVERKAALSVGWARGSGVQERSSDTHYMDNLRARYGEYRPLDATEVYGLWLNHRHNLWDRSNLVYNVPLADVSARVTEDQVLWGQLVEDARRTLVEHECSDCKW